MKAALLALILSASPAFAAPVPRHLFPPEIELWEKMTWYSEFGEKYEIVVIANDDCMIDIRDPGGYWRKWVSKAEARRLYRQRRGVEQ